MKNAFKFKKKKIFKYNLFTTSLYILVIGLFCAFFVINYFNNLLGDNLVRSASLEVNRITSIIINNYFCKSNNNLYGNKLFNRWLYET